MAAYPFGAGRATNVGSRERPSEIVMSIARTDTRRPSLLTRAAPLRAPTIPDEDDRRRTNPLLAALADDARTDRRDDPETIAIYRSLREIRDIIDDLLAEQQP